MNYNVSPVVAASKYKSISKAITIVLMAALMFGCLSNNTGDLGTKPTSPLFIRSSGGALTYCVDGNVVTVAVRTGAATQHYDEVCRG